MVAVVVVILVVAVGAGVYYYATSTVTGTTTTATSTATATTTATVTATSSETPVTITVWETYAPATSQQSEFGAFNKSLTAFEAAYPWITVNVETQPFSSVVSSFTEASLANKAPDVVRLANDQIGAMVLAGYLTPINAYGNTSFFGQYLPNAMKGVQYGKAGDYWALPENINGLALYYNKALVPTPPTTTNQMITDAQAITKTSASGQITTAGIVCGCSGGFGGGYWWWPFLDGFGGSVFNSTGYPELNSTAAVASVEFLNSLVTQYKVMPPTLGYGTADTMFISGHAGMMINGPWDYANYETSNKTLSFGVAALPTVSSTGQSIAPFLGSQDWAIASNKPTNEVAASWDFITFITNYNSQTNLVTLAGDLPSNAALSTSSTVTGSPVLAGFIAQAATSVPAYNTPQMSVVYDDIGGPLGGIQPTTPTSTVTAAQIQAALNTAEANVLRDIAGLG